MEIENINFFIFGAPNSGFRAYPKENIRKVEGFDKTITTNEIYCQQFNKIDSTEIFYIRYGLSSGNENGIGRLGSNFGFCIEINGYTIDKRSRLALFTYMDSIFESIFLNPGLRLLKKGLNISYYVDDFLEIENNINHAISTVIKNFAEDFDTNFELITNNTEKGQFELVPEKIEAIKQEKERAKLIEDEQRKKVKKNDQKAKTSEAFKQEPVPETINDLEKNGNSLKKFNPKIALTLWCFILTLLTGYLFFQNNKIIKEIKKINQQSVKQNPLGSIIEKNDKTVYEEEISGVKKVFLNKQNYLKYLSSNELKVINNEDIIKAIAKYLFSESMTAKNKFSSTDEIEKTINENNRTDISKLITAISELAKDTKLNTIIIKEGSNEDLIPNKILIFQNE